jgi:hypothetical protein
MHSRLGEQRPWDLDATQREILVRRELMEAMEGIRLGFLLARLADEGESVLSFSSGGRRVSLTSNGCWETSVDR